MGNIDLGGIWPPIPTPFRDSKVAYDALQENVARWCQTGITGLVVLGSNGESVLLRAEEKVYCQFRKYTVSLADLASATAPEGFSQTAWNSIECSEAWQ